MTPDGQIEVDNSGLQWGYATPQRGHAMILVEPELQLGHRTGDHPPR